MARDDKWVEKKLRELAKEPPPKASEENLRRAKRHAQGEFTVVKAEDRE